MRVSLARTRGINKIYQTNIIVNSETREEGIGVSLTDTVLVKGNGVEIFELIDSSKLRKAEGFVRSSREV